MFDTNICAYIMRKRPESVLMRLEQTVANQHRIVISAITYSEMRFGASSPKASPKISVMLNDFVQRLDAILPWDTAAIDETARLRVHLSAQGIPIGHNDAAIAGHALATNCAVVTNNTREFVRVPGLTVENWT